MCVAWLQQAGLAMDLSAVPHQRDSCEEEVRNSLLDGTPVYRCVRKSADEICRLRKHYRRKPSLLPENERAAINAVWHEFQNVPQIAAALGRDPVPPDATACYLPFHLFGNKWGIYISLPRVLTNVERLARSYDVRSCILGNFEILLQCVLFELFHHEYFHHIVESALTTLEILVGALTMPQRLYYGYRMHVYEKTLGPHPHKPLEEALANAYAYDALAPIARSKLGCRTLEATLYRGMRRESWPSLKEGYRDAGHYTASDGDRAAFTAGTAQLAAMMLNSLEVSVPALTMVADRVMPSQRTAFCRKNDIPLYLVGPDAAHSFFRAMIPAPRETCVSLFSPRYTRNLDEGLREIAWGGTKERVRSLRRA